MQRWVDALADAPAAPQGTARARGDYLAALLADSLAARATVEQLARIVSRIMPELDRDDALQIIAIALLMTSAAWPRSHPTEALQLTISGLLARRSWWRPSS